MDKPVGLTKDAGWEIGCRKTFQVNAHAAWDFMFSDEGLSLWLGKLQNEIAIKESYKTSNGTEGVIRVFKPFSHIRLTWKKKGWDNVSTLQVRVMDASSGKTTISFHHEKLLNSEQREEMKAHWDKILEKIGKALEKE
jgi:uncharacterized protein YndB with AHSA1/START domain